MAGLGAALLAGCATEPPPAPVVAAPSVSSDQLVGKWGFAAYHRDTDRERTIKEALAQCNKPYVIAKGPNGGVMMNLADQADFVGTGAEGGDRTARPISGRRGRRHG